MLQKTIRYSDHMHAQINMIPCKYSPSALREVQSGNLSLMITVLAQTFRGQLDIVAYKLVNSAIIVRRFYYKSLRGFVGPW